MKNTMAVKPGEDPLHIEMTDEEVAIKQTEWDSEDAKQLSEKPMRDWKKQMASYDKDMPRFLEEHITAHHSGLTGDPFTQERYDTKTLLRSQKPQTQRK